MKYRQIRKFHNENLVSTPIVDYYVYLLTPFFTNFFLKYKIIPNTVTVMMILSGIMGALFFCLPGIQFAVLGIIFMHLWYILDGSDGEVARITKNFSLYGEELDFLAHNIDHPCFTAAFIARALYIDKSYILFIALSYVLDSMYRFTLSLNSIIILKEKKEKRDASPQGNRLFIVLKCIIRNLNNFPLFVLVFPILLMIDSLAGVKWGGIFLIIRTAAALIYTPFCVIRSAKYIYPKKKGERE